VDPNGLHPPIYQLKKITESCKEGYGSKRAVLPILMMMMMMMVTMIHVTNVISLCDSDKYN
jgi:hypothetical protein